MGPVFEWDETKRLSNLEKHGFDFIDLGEAVAGPHLIAQVRTVADERRHALIGLIDGVLVAAIFTYRAEAMRVISIRKARREERYRYDAVFG